MSDQLTPEQREILTLLVEECAEVIQAATKILRHGYDSYHPSGRYDNRTTLEQELGDLTGVQSLLARSKEFNIENVGVFARDKLQRLRQWSHHIDWSKYD
jgi:NTP pyrophosphatase (non-canonical NTP hydrolase)